MSGRRRPPRPCSSCPPPRRRSSRSSAACPSSRFSSPRAFAPAFPGEIVVLPGPLALAPEQAGTPAPSVSLFVDRVRLRNASYAPGAEELALVRDRVEHLEGVPLAIGLS